MVLVCVSDVMEGTHIMMTSSVCWVCYYQFAQNDYRVNGQGPHQRAHQPLDKPTNHLFFLTYLPFPFSLQNIISCVRERHTQTNIINDTGKMMVKNKHG